MNKEHSNTNKEQSLQFHNEDSHYEYIMSNAKFKVCENANGYKMYQ